MIISKPKGLTLFSLCFFLTLCYGAAIWSWFKIPSSPTIWYLIPVGCLSVAMLVTIKIIISYRVLRINGSHWEVQRLIGGNIIFEGDEIKWWKETAINTAGADYKQLHIHAGPGKNVKVSLQEHTDYQKVLKGLKARYGKKQIKE